MSRVITDALSVKSPRWQSDSNQTIHESRAVPRTSSPRSSEHCIAMQCHKTARSSSMRLFGRCSRVAQSIADPGDPCTPLDAMWAVSLTSSFLTSFGNPLRPLLLSMTRLSSTRFVSTTSCHTRARRFATRGYCRQSSEGRIAKGTALAHATASDVSLESIACGGSRFSFQASAPFDAACSGTLPMTNDRRSCTGSCSHSKLAFIMKRIVSECLLLVRSFGVGANQNREASLDILRCE